MAELGAEVVALDVSERMVELARVAESTLESVMSRRSRSRMRRSTLSWPPGCSTTSRSRSGPGEIARVLAPGGRLIAVTNSELHLDEARAHVGVSLVGRVPFNRENGEEILARHFASVERTDVDGGSRSRMRKRFDATSGR